MVCLVSNQHNCTDQGKYLVYTKWGNLSYATCIWIKWVKCLNKMLNGGVGILYCGVGLLQEGFGMSYGGIGILYCGVGLLQEGFVWYRDGIMML